MELTLRLPGPERETTGAVLVEWLVSEGESVSDGDAIAVVEPETEIEGVVDDRDGLRATRREEMPDAALPERRVSATCSADRSGSATVGSHGWTFDVSERFGGGRAPTPIDHFLGALAACLSSSIAVQAGIRDVSFEAIEVETEGHPTDGCVEAIDLLVRLHGCEAEEDTVDRIVEMGERTCHVSELLREELPVELKWERA
ncbi:OsmC family protein [Natronorarus salvus]|uniref:OsmC family protein n=1 Tax=Natronorarus salvus TaxID=3117733 RepID=UPI002F2649CB